MVDTATFKGNKLNLPSKLCVQCKREMTWRKSWAKNWGDVKYCSDHCRKNAKSNKSKQCHLPSIQV